MSDFRIPLGNWISDFIDWLIDVAGAFFDFLRMVMAAMYDGLEQVLTSPPFWVIVIVVAVLAYFSKGWKLAIGSAIGLVLIVALDQWENAMSTLSLVLLASLIALLIAIPTGIWAAKSNRASAVIRPILDFLQTMPAMVYLIPALMLFRIGVVPGMVATIIFSMAPGVRLTELGIRNVDKEVVEAGYAFGSTPGRVLRQIQLPLAMPSIMAGVNQVIMLSLSMVVIAGMVGAGGLGSDVVTSLNRVDVGLGFEAGTAVVVIAMILDRVTSGFGNRERSKAKAEKAAA
ncbi:ABC transporter permease [Ancrocorticia populi]|uniref:Glycine/betaine ABC transporter permease n=1 Tax=Ancrocorticia populi TaxID=2175228 RepID=A0A2V1K7M4_9ACTO|nr:proline/glycine betaine ABC transporter permease [Ancrocorticia populi]PWF26187.1 glycine/betaine ABC transporter permease [Ancrocorticia populi]